MSLRTRWLGIVDTVVSLGMMVVMSVVVFTLAGPAARAIFAGAYLGTFVNGNVWMYQG